MLDDFFESFFFPRRFLRRFVEEGRVRWGCWILFGAIAVLGTWLFGFSFGLVYPEVGTSWNWAWVITVAAGAGWVILIPILVGMCGDVPRRLGAIQACLLTMVYGEAILEVGTILNLIGYWRETLEPERALVGNGALVVISNVAMATAMAAQMKVLGVNVWKTLLCWAVVLNGIGAGVFWLLYRGVLAG